jgi:hypothetical protein
MELLRFVLRGGLGLVLGALVVAPDVAHADRRIFGWSYPYMTLPAGGFELEHYLDAAFSEADDPGTTEVEDALRPSWKHQVEAEYAITDHWDFGLYQVFAQKPYESLRYQGTKLRSRYRFVEQGQWPVDVSLYGEVKYYGDEVGFEQIAILSRMFGPVELVVNAKFEQGIDLASDEVEYEIIPSFGAGYHVTEWFAAALEYQGKLTIEDGETEPMRHFVGPSVSFAGRHFWWTLSYGHQVSGLDEAPDFQVRSIFAVGF